MRDIRCMYSTQRLRSEEFGGAAPVPTYFQDYRADASMQHSFIGLLLYSTLTRYAAEPAWSKSVHVVSTAQPPGVAYPLASDISSCAPSGEEIVLFAPKASPERPLGSELSHGLATWHSSVRSRPAAMIQGSLSATDRGSDCRSHPIAGPYDTDPI
jgi:hypothetical protein